MATFKANALSKAYNEDFLNEMLTLGRNQKLIISGYPQTMTSERSGKELNSDRKKGIE